MKEKMLIYAVRFSKNEKDGFDFDIGGLTRHLLHISFRYNLRGQKYIFHVSIAISGKPPQRLL